MENQPPVSGPEPAAQIDSPGIEVRAPQPPVAEHSFRDRSTGLMIFGIVQIILALFAALMIPLVALGAFMSRLAPGGSMRPGQFVSAVLTYSFMAASLLALGIGSVQKKRWGRALTLVTSWYWLIMGILITILLTAMLPVVMRTAMAQARQNTPGPELPTGMMAVILTFIIVFAAFFLVLVPAAFVIFYSRRDVAETVRLHDPIERWTDRAPLPVLAASVAMLTGSMYMLLVGLTTPLFPFFGRYLTGMPAAACFLVLAAIDVYIAFALFRLQPAGWWLAVLVAPVRIVSMILTYRRADLMQAYSRVGMSDAQLKMLNANPMFRGHIILWWSLISAILFFGYIVWLKRYFKTSAPVQTNAFPAPIN